jgi:Xaa-Pro aminopeptidase
MQNYFKKIESIKKVQYATEQAMQAVINYLFCTKNPTSEQAHIIIDEVLGKYDCESPEYHIVAGGTQAIEPHEQGYGSLDRGVPIVVDIFPRSKNTGYFADMTRTVCWGSQFRG